jgi:hypothetical protein
MPLCAAKRQTWLTVLVGSTALGYGPPAMRLDPLDRHENCRCGSSLFANERRGRIPMMSHRLRRYALLTFGVVLIPPLLWVTVVLVAPTSWAKNRVTSALAAATRRSVRLERLSVGFLGGIRLTNLEIGSPQSIDTPWLKAAALRMEFRFVDVLGGSLHPSSVEVDGANLRVLRRADGTLELADLILPEQKLFDRGRTRGPSAAVPFRLHGGSVTVIDEPSHTRLHMENVEGEGIREDRKLVINSLTGTLNGGPFQFVGELDRTGVAPSFEARFRADDVVLDDGMTVLRYAVPVLAGAPLNLKGHLDCDISAHGQGATWADVSKSLIGHGVIGINPVELDGAPLIAELSRIADLSRQGRVASIRSDFAIKDQRVSTDHFTLNIGRVPMTLSGWTSFDGHIDYRINLKALADRIPDKARRLLGELKVDIGNLATLSLRGTVNQLVVQVNGVALDRNLLRESGFKREDREKLRVLGRQFLDQLSR